MSNRTPIDRCGSGLHGRVENLADAIDAIEPNLDAVARDVVARHAAAVREIEFLLDRVARGANGVFRNAGVDELLLHGAHRVGVLFLGVARLRARASRPTRSQMPDRGRAESSPRRS